MMRYLLFAIPAGVILLFAMMLHPAWRHRVQGVLIWGAVLFLAVVGLIPLLMGLRSIWRGLASARWPSATGVVLKAGVSETRAGDTRSRETYTMYSAKLTFGYQVNGRDYTTETVQFGKALGSGDPSDAAVLMLRYPPGAAVEVRRHPANPAIATVKPGVNVEVVLYLIAGLVFLVLAAVAALGYWSLSSGLSIGRHALSLAWLVMILLGIGLLAPGLQNLWRAYASRDWPRTSGVILFAQPDTETPVTPESQGDALRSTGRGAPLAYEYEVAGKKHYSNVRAFGQFVRSGGKWANRILQRYPTGAGVPVWYCPADPDLAVLEPGISRQAYYLPGAGAAFLLFGLLAVFLTWRR